MYVYDSTRFAEYKDRWILAADSTIAHLASHPSTRPDLTFVAIFNGTQLIYESEHRESPFRFVGSTLLISLNSCLL
jgi:mannosyl-oligosaccharide alpha-1,2-mannosidase